MPLLFKTTSIKVWKDTDKYSQWLSLDDSIKVIILFFLLAYLDFLILFTAINMYCLSNTENKLI